MSQIKGHCRHPELLVKTRPLTVMDVSYLGLPRTLLPGNGVCFALRSCHQNPDSVLPLSGVCPMLSKVTMKSRFSDVPFFFFFPLCAEGYCFLYPKQPLRGWQVWAERKHRSRLYIFVLSEAAEDVFLAPGGGMSG